MIMLTVLAFGEAKGNEPLQEMNTMARVLQENGVSIQQWTIYTREYAQTIENDSAFVKKVDELKQTFPTFQWTVDKDEHVQKATGIYEHSSMQEKIQLVTTVANEKPQTYILYELKGFGWSEKTWKIIGNMINQKLSQLFTKQHAFFSCVKGEFNDKMKGVLFDKAVRLLASFQAQPIESLREETFVSVSAYTEQWKTSLSVGQQQMNLQLALRQNGLGARTTVVIGTPIITSEY